MLPQIIKKNCQNLIFKKSLSNKKWETT